MVPFGANLTNFGAKPTIPALGSNLSDPSFTESCRQLRKPGQTSLRKEDGGMREEYGGIREEPFSDELQISTGVKLSRRIKLVNEI